MASWYVLTDASNDNGSAVFDAGISNGWDDTGYPVIGCLDLTRPLRQTRSNDPTPSVPILAIDLGADISIAAVTVEHTNNWGFDGIQYDQASQDGWTTYPPGVELSTTKVAASDTLDGRVKAIFIDGSSVTARYFRFAFLNTEEFPKDDPGYTYIGSLGFWETATLLTKNWGLPMRETFEQDVKVRKYDSGGSITGAASDAFVGFQVEANIHKSNTTALNEFITLAGYPKNRVIGLYKNDGDIKEVYHVHRVSTASFTETTTQYVRFQIRFSEVY